VKKTRTGFTLAEILVVAFIGVVVIGLCMELLLPSVWMFRVESARSEAQQASLLLVNRLKNELLNSVMDSIYVGRDPVAVVFQQVAPSSQPFDVASGAPVLTDYWRVYHYDVGSRRVIFRKWPPEPPATLSLMHTYPFTASDQAVRLLYQQDLQAIVAHTPNRSVQVMARNVDAVYITDYGNDLDNDLNLLTPPLEISLTCSVDTSMRGAITKESFTASTRVIPRSVRY